ncbi:MAG: hypothetical protein ACOC58_04060 [Chloroflexota bacterium]
MAGIEVSLTTIEGGWLAQVTVADEKGPSSHEVALTEEDYRRLSHGQCPPEELVRASFEFLLQREAKESILAHFALSVIGRYFPEYEGWLAKQLPRA